jgi:hypothetical protein
MNIVQRQEQRPSALGGDSESRVLDRHEDEGDTGSADTRDVRSDARASAMTGDRDVVDPGRVVVTSGSTAQACQVHHGDIPELHADGSTPAEAASNLAQDLEREIASVADHCRRGLFWRALDDVRAFAAKSL